MSPELVRLSKFLSLVLRHRPERIQLALDAQGWAEIAQLIQLSEMGGMRFTRDQLLQVVQGNDKQRFTLSEDGLRIRAAQGHSIDVELGLAPKMPPDILFHGTATRFLAAILVEGLKPRSRQHVHLSADIETAVRVGQRHGKPVVLQVNAARMHQQGREFWQAENGVWLADAVPAEFLTELP